MQACWLSLRVCVMDGSRSREKSKRKRQRKGPKAINRPGRRSQGIRQGVDLTLPAAPRAGSHLIACMHAWCRRRPRPYAMHACPMQIRYMLARMHDASIYLSIVSLSIVYTISLVDLDHPCIWPYESNLPHACMSPVKHFSISSSTVLHICMGARWPKPKVGRDRDPPPPPSADRVSLSDC
jgi:hypothetical protein